MGIKEFLPTLHVCSENFNSQKDIKNVLPPSVQRSKESRRLTSRTILANIVCTTSTLYCKYRAYKGSSHHFYHIGQLWGIFTLSPFIFKLLTYFFLLLLNIFTFFFVVYLSLFSNNLLFLTIFIYNNL